MKQLFISATVGAAVFLSAPTLANDALSIDENGVVNIPGTLRASEVQAGNLDQNLKDIGKQLQDLKNQNARILEGIEWKIFAPTVYDAFVKVSGNFALVNQFEFRINRNTGFRKTHFSSWNKGLRFVTEPYMTGDTQPFRLGGSMWAYQTNDPSDNCGSPKAYHLYYFFKGGNVQTDGGNYCQEEGPVYARKRLLP